VTFAGSPAATGTAAPAGVLGRGITGQAAAAGTAAPAGTWTATVTGSPAASIVRALAGAWSGGSNAPINVTGTVRLVWQAILQAAQWLGVVSDNQWRGGLVIRAVDHRSVEPVEVQVTAPVDISADTVSMAIVLPGTENLPWTPASHVGSAVQQANGSWLLTVQVQVGPGTTIGQLAPGQYAVYAQVSANPSAPVILCGTLTVL
jgi:hypothetical protein